MESSVEDIFYGRAINRIRHYYLELAGEDGRYFMMSGNDDAPGVLANVGLLPGSRRQLFFTTGILGGYTTFSAFSLDTVLLYERSELGVAALYVLGSVALSIGGLFAGLALARHYF